MLLRVIFRNIAGQSCRLEQTSFGCRIAIEFRFASEEKYVSSGYLLFFQR